VQQQRGGHSCHPYTLLPPHLRGTGADWSHTRHPNATPLAPPHPHTLPPAADAAVETKGGGGEGKHTTHHPHTRHPQTLRFHGCTRSWETKKGGRGGESSNEQHRHGQQRAAMGSTGFRSGVACSCRASTVGSRGSVARSRGGCTRGGCSNARLL
ncbi:unnamed protein product, partial [Closterium sp. NIES-53]